ncbi:MAG: polyprenyl synthetase family protein, partial [Rhodospirillales bacterium]|nr:polyprenyl synthetase family protein [Rhodospirillales bacterium]
RSFWQRTIEAQEQSAADLEQALALIARHGAIEVTLARAAGYAASAQAALAGLADTPFRQALRDVADYTVRRAR